MNPVLLEKEHKDIPDHYNVHIWYITGGDEIFKVANHFPIKNEFFEFWSKDNKLNVIPLSSIKRIEFDTNFSKLVEIKEKIDREKMDIVKK